MRRRIVTLMVLAGLLALPTLIPSPSVRPFSEIRRRWRPSDVRLLDRHGELLDEIRSDPNGRRLSWTPLPEVSQAMIAAVIKSEDRRFYQHQGIDYRAMAAAALARAIGHRRGGSTITMQLAALIQEGPRSHTLLYKFQQARMARALERKWTKDQILEAYLNLVTYRGEFQGIRSAATFLFGKEPHGITQPEAEIMAVLLRAPNASQRAVLIRALVLNRTAAKPVPDIDLRAVVAKAFASSGSTMRTSVAPHIAERLMARESRDPLLSTLDGSLQRFAEATLRRQLLEIRDRNVSDGAAIVVDNKSGDVLAYVGSIADLSSASYVDGIRARRQPGSALKPFLYGLAIEKRLITPATLLEDTPLDVSVIGGLYRPRDYDEQFRGLVSVRTALASSLNVPAVRTLGLVGFDEFVRQLRSLGFENLVETGDYYGPSLALGSADVTLWELMNAYRTLANGGIWSPARIAPDESTKDKPRRIFSEDTAFLISNILADREGRSETFGLENSLATGFWSAVKTGTSKDMRDNWCVGYSMNFTVGVWVGNFSGEPMRDVSGVTGAAPVWYELINHLENGRNAGAPIPPPGLVSRRVSFARGVEPDRIEWFFRGTEPSSLKSTIGTSTPRIVAPAPETIVAFDPDIPASRQKIAFQATGVNSVLRWTLDEKDEGPAQMVLWSPRPGSHKLSLVDSHARIVDSIMFSVRGATVAEK